MKVSLFLFAILMSVACEESPTDDFSTDEENTDRDGFFDGYSAAPTA